MYYLQNKKKELVKVINEILGDEKIVSENVFEYPPNIEMGDLSLPCFSLVKNSEFKNPSELAKFLCSRLGEKNIVSSIKTVGPYLNFHFKREELAQNVFENILEQKDVYGSNKNGDGQRVMIEYSNANTHKEYHVGHLRNLSFGDAVNRILKVNGYQVFPVSYINDFGIHTAKTLWYLGQNKNFQEDLEKAENKGFMLGQAYVASVQQSTESKTAKGEIEFVMKKIEARSGEEYKLWEKTREWSIEQFGKIYQELNICFEHIYYESEFIDQGRIEVQELIKKGILKVSEGAVIADLSEYGLGVLVILRSDGTATYPVADLPLAEAKFKDYQLNKSIYVVDNRQKLYFQQLFKILELMGYNQEKIHLEHDFVKLPSGMMSSRSGNTITYEELKTKMLEVIKKEIAERHSDWTQEKIEKTSWVIAVGAMKFEMLKIGNDQIINFDIQTALAFSGYTAMYLQYTYARLTNILKKGEIDLTAISIDFKNLEELKEHEIFLKISKYHEIIIDACSKYDPSIIAKYLFELAQFANDYYHAISILKEENEKKKIARLALISSVNQIIKNGLEILGIEVVCEI